MILREDSILYRYSNRNKKKEEGMSNLFPMKKIKKSGYNCTLLAIYILKC